MEYLFVLGRNPDLSFAEVKSYAIREENKILSYFRNKGAVIVEFLNPLKKDALQKLGGVISIGEIFVEGSLKEMIGQLERREIYTGKKNNFGYSILNFGEDSAREEISKYLKRRFKTERFKAFEKRERGEKEYFLFQKKERFCFGKILERCNYSEIEKRDMGKPIRREELSISPRLAKIMINLSQIKENQKLIDPFCGIGVILQEALLQKIRTIGIDKEKDAVLSARKNLEWFNFPKKSYSLINSDSAKIQSFKANVLVTEPDFGELLKKIPSSEKAKQMQKNYEELMIRVLNNLKESLNGRIVFTAPLILAEKRRITCDLNRILKKTNLILVEGFPISDFREGQIVGREICVLERKSN